MKKQYFRRWMMIILSLAMLGTTTQMGQAQGRRSEAARELRRRAEDSSRRSSETTSPTLAAKAGSEKVTTGTTAQAIAKEVAASATKEAEVTAKGGLIMNFRNTSLDTVLNYLSKAAGFIIIRDSGVAAGPVDVISQQPMNKEEAVQLLNSVLAKKGYAAIQNDRTLKILPQSEAGRNDIPVVKGSEPKEIKKSDEMVTQILPVKYATAAQIIQNLEALLPPYATVSANDSTNAIVLTATKTDVRRMAEIIQALDTSISDLTTMKVYILKFAVATDIAKMFGDLFKDNTSSQSNGRGGPGGFPFGGRGGMMGMMFGRGSRGGPSGGSQPSQAQQAAQRVTAVADDRTNALVVSAPNDLIPTIDALVQEIDVSTDALCEIRVFSLRYADATMMAQTINDVFQSQMSSSSGSSSGFGGRGSFGGRGGSSRSGFMQRFMGMGSSSSSPTRASQQSMVYASPDIRTNSIIVNADKDLMEQIAPMIERLDKDPSKDKKVFVYPLKYADAQQTAAILDEMFGQGQRNGRSSLRNQQQSNGIFGNNNNRSSSGSTIGSGSNRSSGGNVPRGLSMD